MKSTHAADLSLDSALDALSDRFDAARNAARRRLEGGGLTPDEALFSVLSTLTEAAERIAPEVRKKAPRRTARPRVAAGVIPFPSARR